MFICIREVGHNERRKQRVGQYPTAVSCREVLFDGRKWLGVMFCGCGDDWLQTRTVRCNL